MGKLGNILGWVSAAAYIFALSHFFIKYIGIKKINKIIIRYHKIAGIIAFVSAAVHFYLMYVRRGLSLLGLTAFIIMFVMIVSGVCIPISQKENRKKLIVMHKILSILLFLIIIIHILVMILFTI